jgi:hypothetical protein
LLERGKKVDKKGDTNLIDICSKLTDLRLNLIHPDHCAMCACIAVERSKDYNRRSLMEKKNKVV